MTCHAGIRHDDFKRHLDFAATQDAFLEGLKSYTSQNYQQAIKFYIQALNALESDLLSVIRLHYAAACAMDEKYNRGLGAYDDSEGSQSSPIPNSYFDQTASLITRDDELGPFFRIDTKRLKATTPPCGEHSKWIELPGKRPDGWLPYGLPLEIVTRILSHLPLKNRARLALTCRSWYNFIMREWDEMWSTIDLTGDEAPSESHTLHQFLHAVSPCQVRKVKMDMSDIADMTPGSLDAGSTLHGQGSVHSIVKQLNWNKVGSFDIAHPKKTPFRDLLEYSKNTLRSLNIHSNDNSDYCADALVDAAQICRNLQSVCHHVNTSSVSLRYAVAASLPSSDLHLTRLTLSFSMQSETLLHLLRNSPHLTSLTLYPQHQIGRATLLETIHTYCNALQEFSYKHFSTQCHSTYSLPDDLAESYGLKYLELKLSCHTSDGNSIDRVLCKMIEDNHSTLETLNLDLESINGSDHKSLKTLMQHPSPRLQTLELNQQMGSTFSYHGLSDLITSCASLTSVTLYGAYFWHDDVLRALGNPRLKELNMYVDHDDSMNEQSLDDGEGTITIQGMQELFDRACNLSNFSFGYNYYFPSPRRLRHSFVVELAELIGAHPSIRTIEFQDVPMQNGQLIEIMDRLKTSQVQKMYMELNCHVHMQELEALASLIRLEYLYINDACDTLRKHKLVQLFEKCASERFLYVEVTSEKTSNVMKGLKRIPTCLDEELSIMYCIEGDGFEGNDDTDSSESSEDYDESDSDDVYDIF